ncbi:MAG: bifunctional folylpolyglutamate synthase/dihydrofolate synthase [Prevotellaceae bacterium]|jgi:dihydrofolate synthase/folylpolyglutamate synthase|nr:bifunctional folylpolyglutamate synthase/dihydrofolate synthase [Prevotellaceae bacterium]
MYFTTYAGATAYLFARLPMYQQVGNIAYKASLATPEALDRYFEHPHRAFRSIHVAGTNGKGSVAHMLAAALQQAGLRVGLYTSPHLKDFRERIRINGQCITEAAVLDFVNRYRQRLEEEQASFFEMTTAMAFDYFAQQRVNVAVIETGMGGRLDATNIIRPVLSIITNIAFDHTEHLGDSPALIAREKAGIIKPQTPVIIGEYSADTAPVFAAIAHEQQAPLRYADRHVHVTPVGHDGASGQTFRCSFAGAPETALTLTLDLCGDYQQANLRTVLTAIDCLRHAIVPPIRIPDESILSALKQTVRLTGLQGRWQILAHAPLTVCDTGHNAHGLNCVFRQLAGMNRPLHIVFGVMADKDLGRIIPLMPRHARYYFTQAATARALDATRLTAQCLAAGLQGEPFPHVGEALAAAREQARNDEIIYIGGSNFVVAEALF